MPTHLPDHLPTDNFEVQTQSRHEVTPAVTRSRSACAVTQDDPHRPASNSTETSESQSQPRHAVTPAVTRSRCACPVRRASTSACAVTRDKPHRPPSNSTEPSDSQSQQRHEVTPAVTRSRSACAVRRTSNTHDTSERHRKTNVAARRASKARRRRAARTAILAARRLRTQPTRQADDDSAIIRDHFTRMRAPRHPTLPPPASNAPLISPKGIQEFNSMTHIPDSNIFENTVLTHEDNYVCPHCGAMLWKEERKNKYNCCKNGEYATHPLRPIPADVWDIFYSSEFSRNQRRYNSLFSFIALGAGGMDKRTWTNPPPASMLTMHGKAYHRIFDLQEQYENLTVGNTARLYIYDSDFTQQSQSTRMNHNIATSLRNYITGNIPWAHQYKAAVDTVINSPNVTSGPAFIEFADVSRANDGPVIGQPVAAPEIAALLYPSGQRCTSTTQPIVTYPKDSPDSKPRFLPLWSSAIEPLQFPFLFCKGESGWSKGHKSEVPPYKSRTMNRSNTKHVPFLFYCRQRLLCEPVFKTNSRIAQEWSCSMYSRFEEDTLTFVERDAMQQRLSTYRSVKESTAADMPGNLLPASFHGSPLKRKKNTEDALAVVNRKGKPHVMLTVTCNPLWSEIVDNLEPNQSASDRPDLCCRVFKIKLGEIMKELKSGNVFGPYDYHMYTIEFQKRGLPHAHIVARFKGDGPNTPDLMDSWVWAQLPSASIAEGRLREKVLKFMVHRHCGANNPNSPCMETNRQSRRKYCNKYYPQPFRSTATVNEKSGRAEYKRTDNGDTATIRQKVEDVWKDVTIDNQLIVPYNPYLLLKFDCHICVDVVTAASCVKYLFKYVTKGADMAKARISGISSEVEQYRQTRYISAAEANWRLLGFDLLNRAPAVTLLFAHLEGENHVVFTPTDTHEQRQHIAEEAVSDLMRYFKRPIPSIFTPLSMLDYYESYVVTKKKKDHPIPSAPPPGSWLDGYGNVVSERQSPHVCRIKFQTPAVGDLFYLRLLLHKWFGRSFLELRTVRNPEGQPIQHPTFHDAARARGLISGEEEYFICMEEAISFQMPHQLRGLFVTLILDGGPAPKLWTDYQDDLIEDLTRRFDREEASQEALRLIDIKLQLHGKTNEQLGLPSATHRQTEYQRMKSSFDADEQTSYADVHEPLLTSEQLRVYTAVIDAVKQRHPKAFMIDAPAGTGKTFTEKVIASRLRGEGYTVIAVASTGIAALQLPGGWTAHSMFKLPLNEYVVPGAMCNINSETQRAELSKKCDVIIFDETPMTHKYCIEALDITLRDLMRNSSIFGGKTIIFSGDFRQIGPIVQFGSAADTVEASIISSYLWRDITRVRLTISQRDRDDAAYASFVRAVGENRQPSVRFPDGADLMPLSNSHDVSSTDHFTLQHTTDFDTLAKFVYPDPDADTRLLHDRALLATTNSSIDASNDHITDKRPGSSATFYSSDTLVKDDSNTNTAFASPEHLNSLNVQGVPPHQLHLKSDALAMITRNLNFSEGLVNGQKVVLRGISPNSRVIQVDYSLRTNQSSSFLAFCFTRRSAETV